MAARKTKGKAVAKWSDELAKHAIEAAEMEANTGGGQFFGTKSGVLTWQDAPLPNNEMAVVILDSIFEYVYYEGDYDPDNVSSPTAFALGRDEDELTWHENSHPDYAGELCKDSDINQWGSADTGRGKACKNSRRLALISAGDLDRDGEFTGLEDDEYYQSTAIGFMKLPVTSVKGYASFVKQVAGALKRPPFGIVTKVRVIPDDKSQFKVVFEPLDELPDELIGPIMERVEEAKSTIDFPYPAWNEGYEEEEEPAPRRKTKSKAVAKKAPAKKKAVAKKKPARRSSRNY